MLRARLIRVSLCVALVGCAKDDDGSTTSDSHGDTGSSGGSLSEAGDLICPPGHEGCACDAGSCNALLICVDDVCIVDTESDSGPSTTLDSGSSDDEGTSSSTDDGASSSDTGAMTCTNSDDCPRGEVCTAPSSSPGVPAGDFTCGRTCAGLGIDAAVCTDDASCCGAFCMDGSCLAP
ncbi:MAG TPA: hypothetical protein VG755_32880 [Nannocystaceae bacterium]|nr:hypothetical protein [Nannocystaceae bacterium]